MEKDLLSLEKIVKKIIKNKFRDSTLDYTVQISISSIEPSTVKYSALISSPSRNVQEIPFVFKSYKELEYALQSALDTFKYEDIEKAEVESRINVYKQKTKELEQYLDMIEKRGLDENGFLRPEDEVNE